MPYVDQDSLYGKMLCYNEGLFVSKIILNSKCLHKGEVH
jgi:hypothetical protein